MAKQFAGVNKELILRELRNRFDGGQLKNCLPKEILQSLKEK